MLLGRLLNVGAGEAESVLEGPKAEGGLANGLPANGLLIRGAVSTGFWDAL